MKNQKKLNWRKLRDLANSLPEEALDSIVIWWGDEKGGIIDSVTLLEEPYGLYDYSYEPMSLYEDLNEPPKKILPKGTPILNVD